MAVPFVPPIAPSPGTQIEHQLALIKTSFGDGYGQVAPNGLNHIRKSVTYRWDGLTLEQARELESFFVARKGVEPFTYRLRGESSDRKWTCERWTRSDNAPHTFSATFEESFSLS